MWTFAIRKNVMTLNGTKAHTMTSACLFPYVGLPTLWRTSFENSQANHIYFLQLINVNCAYKRKVVLEVSMLGLKRGLKNSDDASTKDGAPVGRAAQTEQSLTSMKAERNRLDDERAATS